MNKIYVRDLVNFCNAKLLFGKEDIELENFCKDTRVIEKNDIFIGIKGEKFDGSSLYEEALEKGALGCILNEDIEISNNVKDKYSDRFIVVCKDTIKCIQLLAEYKRSMYNIPVIGVTGSVGKTSTKDIIASILERKYKVLKTEENYNNHIGVPLTILKLKDHTAAVIEMGMNNLGEISILSKISKPTVSVITNVGTAHIGNLGSRENILKAKLEILDGMDNNGILVINNDNDLLHKWYLDNNNNYNIITFGIENNSNYMANNIKSSELFSTYEVLVNNKAYDFKINIPGIHFVINGLCAFTIGKIFDIDINDIKLGIENFVLTKRRMEIEKLKDITIINDCYNANLDSMNGAINYLGSLKGRKIAVLGDMLELGNYSEKLHRLVAKTINDNNIDYVITVGEYTKYINDELLKNNYNINNLFHFDNNKDAFNKLKEIIKKDDKILLKASYGMKFGEIYNYLKEYNI